MLYPPLLFIAYFSNAKFDYLFNISKTLSVMHL